MSLLAAGWNRAVVEELRDFPAGLKDDQVDALSRAFTALDEPRVAPTRVLSFPFMAR